MTSDTSLKASPESIEEWIIERIAEVVNLDPSDISNSAKFESFGIDSAKAISIVMDLEEQLDLPDELPLELLFEAESIAEAARNISAHIKSMSGGGSAFFGGEA